ncbi:hypothetical protein [Bifidobacterium polysaccharolyticum]|uniref:hypothetical protein n=1 Tax=Bifidobacterium polysaccharolyticum TaxID=2750967 RepID=UPI001E35D412|nr:hypothetical protein [Bifidobacterium polysaccharolyticum]
MDLNGEGLLLASGDGDAVGIIARACSPVLSNEFALLLPAVGVGAMSSVFAYAPVEATTSASPIIAVKVNSLRVL